MHLCSVFGSHTKQFLSSREPSFPPENGTEALIRLSSGTVRAEMPNTFYNSIDYLFFMPLKLQRKQEWGEVRVPRDGRAAQSRRQPGMGICCAAGDP